MFRVEFFKTVRFLRESRVFLDTKSADTRLTLPDDFKMCQIFGYKYRLFVRYRHQVQVKTSCSVGGVIRPATDLPVVPTNSINRALLFSALATTFGRIFVMNFSLPCPENIEFSLKSWSGRRFGPTTPTVSSKSVNLTHTLV